MSLFRKIVYFALLVLLWLPAASVLAQDDYYHPELEWKSIETEHFFVHFHEGTERTARTVAKIAEEIYEPVTSLYDHKPDGKVSFVIRDYDDYSNGAAYFFDNKIEIWASALDFDLRGTHNWLRNVVTHEFTHIVQIQTSLKYGRRVPAMYFQWFQYENERRPDVLYGYPNVVVSYPLSGYVVPSWFAEGVAQYNRKELGYDSWDAHRDMILRMYALDGNMLTWNEMSVFGKTSLGNESSYNAGFAFVKYIADRFGEDKLKEISGNLSTLGTVTIDGAIEKAVGINGKDLYDEWKEYLRTDYASRTSGVRSSQVAGNIIADVGFGNFYPAYSPDGSSIAYVSNKDADYFGLSSIYVYDIKSKTEKALQSGVRSTVSWSPDGKRLYYAKTSRSNAHWSNVFDLYVYDIEKEEETRLTRGLRANSPSVSPDGSTLAYVAGGDGTINLFTMHVDGTGTKQLTTYTSGEQVYNPKWSPDGKSVLFDYSVKDGRDIALISADGGEPSFVLATSRDERNGIFTPDGRKIIYASDATGIFNLYAYDLSSRESVQLTNVLGGAFMPSVSGGTKIAFATYTSGGYKIAAIDSVVPLTNSPGYTHAEEKSYTGSSIGDVRLPAQQFDWPRLRSYNDSTPPSFNESNYKNIATSLSVVPFVRIDNYNPKSKGYELVKLGAYAFSSDVTERYGFFMGADINVKGERDLFFNFDFRGKVPGLFQLGLEPAVTFEAYNVTRQSHDAALSIQGRPDISIPVTVTYNLIEFDIAMKQKIFTEALEMEVRYGHSWYTANVGSFWFYDSLSGSPPFLNPAFANQYFNGNDLSATLFFEAISPSRTSEINPTGRKIRLRYDYEFSKFNPNSEYEVVDGLLVPKYQSPRFHRMELTWRESHKLPFWKHTLGVQLRGGTIFGPNQDDFFDFYIGGLVGMKGYPFYSLGGNEFVMGTLMYRFPVVEHIDFRMLQMYFDKLYAAVFADIGNAWSGGGLGDRPYRRDAGVEIRLESFSYYAFPTRLFFSSTYGFDQFNYYIPSTAQTVTYGREWAFHLGILFGFDID